MSTPPPVVRDDGEQVQHLLETVRRHRGGLDQALEKLERHLLGPSTEKAPPETKQPG